jgi:predicted enzyme related to lactoylglutathione lyase
MTEFTRATPILRMEDMARTVDHYVNVLGFNLADWSDEDFGSVTSGECVILLSHGSQGCPGTWVYISVEDVDVLFEELKQTSADIVQDPTEKPWALEMCVQDPDGHILRFGSEPRDFDG